VSLVKQDKFDELVANTTSYLQMLVNRVEALEKQVAELEKPKAPRTRKVAADDA
jgi:BMFP domain-containing protein YqiC